MHNMQRLEVKNSDSMSRDVGGGLDGPPGGVKYRAPYGANKAQIRWIAQRGDICC